MNTRPSRPRVLLLCGKATDQQQVIAALSGSFDLYLAKDSEDAQRALRNQMFDAVFADVGDFLPLERAMVGQLSTVVLNSIGEGVCVVDTHGDCVWANSKLREFPPHVYDRVKEACGAAEAQFLTECAPGSKPRSKKYSFALEGDRYFEAVITPILDSHSHIHQLVAVVWDASSGRKLQQRLNAIDAAGRALVTLDSESMTQMNVSQRLKLLEEKIIQFSRDLMHFDHFCIRLINKRTNRLELVTALGLPPQALEVDLYAEPAGNGISGFVAATGRSYICHDVEKDPRYVLGLDQGRSALTVPLRLHDKVLGIFNIESREQGAFDEDDRQIAEIFGRYIALALNILDLLVVERFTISGRLADNVTREISAPLNDILTESQQLMEEYIGNDEMRARLNRIQENVTRIRTTMQTVSQGPNTILGADQVKKQENSPLAGKRVMISDDEPNIRITIGDVLKKMGCEVFLCKDGHEAVNLVEQQPLDLVISDIRMPHRNGYEIYAVAHRKNENLPVILMTGFGYDPHHSIVRASQEGLSAVLYKPFKVEGMLLEVYKALKIEPPVTPPDAAAPAPDPNAGKPNNPRPASY